MLLRFMLLWMLHKQVRYFPVLCNFSYPSESTDLSHGRSVEKWLKIV